MKKYMIVEHFHADKIKTLYTRFEEQGRMLPAGVVYLDSWIDEQLKVCYQLMQSEDIDLLKKWVDHWKDLADFEIIPVISSAEAKRKVFAKG